jgi:hypothetical protein
MPTFRRLDDEFVAELGEIDRWLDFQGIKQHNRFRAYEKNIAWLRKHDTEDERGQVYQQLASEGRLTEVLSTMVDSIEIVETIPVLRDCHVEIPMDLLRTAFSGPADALRENFMSNKARNAMFELNMAAMVARHGLKPALSTANPDISFEFNKRHIKIECKRAMTESGVFELIRKGIGQLKKSVDHGTSDLGIVAISLSRLLNSGDMVIVTSDPHGMLTDCLRSFLKQAEHRLGGMAKPWVMGLLFYLSSPVYVPGVGYSRGKHGTVFPLDRNQQPFLQTLAHAMQI